MESHDSDLAWNHLVPESPWSKTQWDRHSRNARWFVLNQFHKGWVCWKAVPAALNLYFRNFCSEKSSSVHLFIHLYFPLSNRSKIISAISFWTKTQILTADCSPNTIITIIAYIYICMCMQFENSQKHRCSAVRLIVFPETHRHLNQSRTANRQPKPPCPSESSHFLQRLGT